MQADLERLSRLRDLEFVAQRAGIKQACHQRVLGQKEQPLLRS